MYFNKEDALQAEHNALVKAIEGGNDYPLFAGLVVGIVSMTKELLRQDKEAKT